MRQKRPNRPRAVTPVPPDPIPIDLGDTVRQLAHFETGNGLQQGVVEIGVALLAAFMFVPLRPFLRSGSRNRR